MNEIVRCFFFCWVVFGSCLGGEMNIKQTCFFLLIYFFYSAAVTLVLACFGYKYVLTTQFIHTLLYKLSR